MQEHSIRSFMPRQRYLRGTKEKIFSELWPLYGLQINQQMLNFTAIFGRSAPITIEIGFGNGEVIFDLASKNLDQDYIGIEVYRPGIVSLLAKLKQTPLTNIRIIDGDAVAILKNSIPDSCIDNILILFSDPWPKRRHNKRRIIQNTFVTTLQQKLKNGGQLQIATDWQDYAEHISQVLQAFPHLQPLKVNNYRPQTKFEDRGQKLGHKIWDFLYQKCVITT
jgi:tRNA (guanine-N7-)-methyltransferase